MGLNEEVPCQLRVDRGFGIEGSIIWGVIACVQVRIHALSRKHVHLLQPPTGTVVEALTGIDCGFASNPQQNPT